MKRLKYILITILSFSFLQVHGQPPRTEKIKALKVAYITDKLELSSDQAEKFWPVYHKYEKEMRQARMNFIGKNYKRGQEFENAEEAMNFIDDNLEFQEAALNIRKRYKEEFLKVISAQQIADLYIAEREFKRMLLKQLQQRGSRMKVRR